MRMKRSKRRSKRERRAEEKVKEEEERGGGGGRKRRKFVCVCLLFCALTLTSGGHSRRRPPGYYRKPRVCEKKCLGTRKRCELTYFRRRPWYKCITECVPLKLPCNGNVAVRGYTPGDTATYTCMTGFKLQGNPKRTCHDNGKWSGVTPCCKLACQDNPEYSLYYGFSSYKIVVARLEWEEAKKNCHKELAKLVEIDSAVERSFLSINIDQGNNDHWTGGNDIGEEGVWKWDSTDGTYVFTGDGGTAQNCMAISGFQHDEYDDRNCTKELRSVCECLLEDPAPV